MDYSILYSDPSTIISYIISLSIKKKSYIIRCEPFGWSQSLATNPKAIIQTILIFESNQSPCE